MIKVLERTESNIFPFLRDSINASTINVSDSAITIQRIGNISGCTQHNYIRFLGSGLQGRNREKTFTFDMLI